MNSPMPVKHNSGSVKWPAFLTLFGIAVVAAAGFNSFVWAQHARTMDQFEKRMVEQFKNVEKRLDRIDNKLEKR